MSVRRLNWNNEVEGKSKSPCLIKCEIRLDYNDDQTDKMLDDLDKVFCALEKYCGEKSYAQDKKGFLHHFVNFKAIAGLTNKDD